MKLVKIKTYNNVFSYKTGSQTLYAYRFRYYDLYGRRHEKQARGFTSALAAHKAELKMELKASDNEIMQIVDSTITVKKWLIRYYEMTNAKWKQSYRINYQENMRNHIIPLIGHFRLSQLSRMQYDYSLVQPLSKKLSQSTVANVHRQFMAAVNAAVEENIIPRNPLDNFKFKRDHGQALTKDDLLAFNKLLHEEDIDYRVLFLTLEYTGMRKGEALALTWSDIDFKQQCLFITKTRGQYATNEPKTAAGNRVVTIGKTLTLQLKKYRWLQKKKALRIGNTFNSEQLVFTSRLNKPINPSTVNYHFRSLMEAAGIPKHKYVVHSLRHTHATLLLDAKVSPAEIAKRLGHSNSTVTLSVYSHAVAGRQKQIASKFDDIISQ
ncbi:tyrosine-type recombinase/integrase [Lactiplantibacillus plantarum]|uniref:tyrosine-type recombinase/integrase n=1 Tax=Lactiplantibacillus plantarum TaxID=1590 RepID=UPI001456064D|nr:site-specific integrase [Lactiplantibacillus plantarum]NLS62843.1 tyrosine-type recombinase/integrase [Lactiplantibacillus plantarum]